MATLWETTDTNETVHHEEIMYSRPSDLGREMITLFSDVITFIILASNIITCLQSIHYWQGYIFLMSWS